MPYTFAKIAPTPSWLTVSASGLMSIVAGQVPAIGYQGTARISVTDGAATVTIDVPINIAGRVDGQGRSLYQSDIQIVQAIESRAIALSAMIDVIAQPPAIIATTAIASSAIVDTAQSSGGGGSGDWDNMALEYQTTGGKLSTKPPAAGSAGDVKNVWRRQQFISSLGSGLINSANSEVLDCTIERSQVWQYRDAGVGIGEWLLTTQNEIFVDITSVDSTPIEWTYFANPSDLGIVPDFVGQRCTYRHASQTSSGEYGYSSHRSRITTTNTGLATGTSGQYWTWESQAMYATGS